MAKEDKFALGLDVAKASIDICLLSQAGKKSTVRVENCRDGFLKLASWLHEIDISNIHACLEPTGKYSRGVANFLVELGINVSQVNSFAVLHHGRSLKFRSKTDKIDSFLLADYCLKNNPPAWNRPEEVDLELRQIQKRLINLDESIQQEQNRLKAGIDSKDVLEDIETSLAQLMIRKEKLEKVGLNLIRSNQRIHANFKIIDSILGIGAATAMRLLAFIKFEDFGDGRKTACFAGLTPKKFESGTSIHRKERISKMGNSELRAGLYFPAMVAIQHNPQMRAFAERLQARNKHGGAIVVAVMRKLLVLATTLVRKQEMYDPHYGMGNQVTT